MGSIEQRRNGVDINSIIEILSNPDDIKPITKRKNGLSQKFVKDGVGVVSINPETGNLIQVNPLTRERIKHD